MEVTDTEVEPSHELSEDTQIVNESDDPTSSSFTYEPPHSFSDNSSSNESTISAIVNEPPKKRPKRLASYNENYHKLFPFIRQCHSSVKGHLYKFHCDMCNTNISCGHGGLGDVKRHVSTSTHRNNQREYERNQRINTLLRPEKFNKYPSLQAEVKFSMMLIQHNSFFNLSDHLTTLINHEFKDSIAAKNFSCRRTKTAAIVNCLGDIMFESLRDEMSESPFSLMIDGSNDDDTTGKMYPITVRLYDVNFSRVMTKFLDINFLEGRHASTAETMFASIDTLLNKCDATWDFCVGLGMDNTNANMGLHNSIKSRALKKNKDLIVTGCPCHILHNAASKAGASFTEVCGFDVEDHATDLFYWFERSSKRKSILKEYQEFCSMEYEAVIKLISTRWLCLERCVNRELKKYEGIKSYFLSESFNDARFKRLRKTYNDPMTEIYLFFYVSCLPQFTVFNKFLQREEPLIHKLHSAQQRFMEKLAAKFIKPVKIQEHKARTKSLAKLDITLENQKDDADLYIGLVTRTTMLNLLEKGDISHAQVDKFYDAVRAFFTKAYTYCVQWLPLDDPLLINSIFVDFERRNEASFENIERTIIHFGRIHDAVINDPSILSSIEEEFMDYQAMSHSDIPDHVWKDAEIDEGVWRMDIIWGHLKPKLDRLAQIALAVLVIPHSNAAEERVFSMIRKNKTEFRANMQMSTLNSIMRVKMGIQETLVPCHSWKPSREILARCKAATRHYNEQHKSKQ